MSPFPPIEVQWRWWLCTAMLVALLVYAVRDQRRNGGRRSWRPLVSIAACSLVLWLLACSPPVQDTVEALRLAQCKNNVKWVGMTLHQYHDQHGRFPSPATVDGVGPPTSWRIDLLPLFDPAVEFVAAIDYDRTLAWDHGANLLVAQHKPGPFHCPTAAAPRDAVGRWNTAYALLTGPGTAFPPEGPLSIHEIRDGTSWTILLVEACGSRIVWTEPRDIDVSRQSLQVNAPGEQAGMSNGLLSSWHSAGTHCLLADGSVRFLNPSISEDVLRALSTAAGEDKPGEF